MKNIKMIDNAVKIQMRNTDERKFNLQTFVSYNDIPVTQIPGTPEVWRAQAYGRYFVLSLFSTQSIAAFVQNKDGNGYKGLGIEFKSATTYTDPLHPGKKLLKLKKNNGDYISVCVGKEPIAKPNTEAEDKINIEPVFMSVVIGGVKYRKRLR